MLTEPWPAVPQIPFVLRHLPCHLSNSGQILGPMFTSGQIGASQLQSSNPARPPGCTCSPGVFLDSNYHQLSHWVCLRKPEFLLNQAPKSTKPESNRIIEGKGSEICFKEGEHTYNARDAQKERYSTSLPFEKQKRRFTSLFLILPGLVSMHENVTFLQHLPGRASLNSEHCIITHSVLPGMYYAPPLIETPSEGLTSFPPHPPILLPLDVIKTSQPKYSHYDFFPVPIICVFEKVLQLGSCFQILKKLVSVIGLLLTCPQALHENSPSALTRAPSSVYIQL